MGSETCRRSLCGNHKIFGPFVANSQQRVTLGCGIAATGGSAPMVGSNQGDGSPTTGRRYILQVDKYQCELQYRRRAS